MDYYPYIYPFSVLGRCRQAKITQNSEIGCKNGIFTATGSNLPFAQYVFL